MKNDFVGALEVQVRAAMHNLLPAMQVDGGGARILSLEDGNLVLQLIGTCISCPSRELSAKSLAEALTLRVPSLRKVCILRETDPCATGDQAETLFQIGAVS